MSLRSLKRNASEWMIMGSLALIAPHLACVTVNVNFPESAVQKATDDYVRDLYKAKEKGKSTPSAGPTKTPESASLIQFNPFIQSANAEEPEFRVDTAKAQKIKTRLRSRLDDLIAQKKAGVIGESYDGQLVLKSPEKVKPLLKKKIEKLISDDNDDREDLYKEVLKANSLPSNHLKDIQSSFARSFQAHSPSGTWIQSSDGKWEQKP